MQTRAEEANKGTGVRQGPEPTDELWLEEQVVRKASLDPLMSCLLPPKSPFSPPWLDAWHSQGSHLQEVQGIFLTQGLNPGLPHCRWILYPLRHQGSPLGGV